MVSHHRISFGSERTATWIIQAAAATATAAGGAAGGAGGGQGSGSALGASDASWHDPCTSWDLRRQSLRIAKQHDGVTGGDSSACDRLSHGAPASGAQLMIIGVHLAEHKLEPPHTIYILSGVGNSGQILKATPLAPAGLSCGSMWIHTIPYN